MCAGWLPHLETLELRRLLLSDEAYEEEGGDEPDPLTALCTAMSQGTALQRLRKLSLHRCMEHEDGIRVLLVGLSRLPELRHLHMAVSMDYGLASALQDAIAPLPQALGPDPPFPKLEVLELSAMLVSDFRLLLEAMGSERGMHGLPSLTKLKVRATRGAMLRQPFVRRHKQKRRMNQACTDCCERGSGGIMTRIVPSLALHQAKKSSARRAGDNRASYLILLPPALLAAGAPVGSGAGLGLVNGGSVAAPAFSGGADPLDRQRH